MAVLGIGEKKNTVLTEYAPGRYYDPNTTVLGGSYEDLYNEQAYMKDAATGGTKWNNKVNVSHSSLDLTPEQQLAIKNNKNMKETQNRLKSQGVGQQQSVLGGGGY